MHAMGSDPDYSAWIGRTEERADTVTAVPMAALAATLDRDDPAPERGTLLPPLWHWLYFLPVHRQSELGPDGHPRRGGFLPPVALPRRMWAGSRLRFEAALCVGDAVTRTSRIAAVTAKSARSGPLVFVTVQHRIDNAAGLAIEEEHDIVYRGLVPPGAPTTEPPPAPTDDSFAREIDPDEALLFRYSALTFNGHRIHYDRSYVTGVEGYPGLVVHGPLIATLLVDEARRQRPGLVVRRFEFKAVQPLFDIAPFALCCRFGSGTEIDLWARGYDGRLAMSARIEAGE